MRFITLLLASILMLAGDETRAATLTIDVSANVSNNGFKTSRNQIQTSSPAISIGDSVVTERGSASAIVSAGMFGVTARTSYANVSSTRSGAKAEVSDFLTISSSGRNGEVGTLRVPVRIDGIVGGRISNSSARYSTTFGVTSYDRANALFTSDAAIVGGAVGQTFPSEGGAAYDLTELLEVSFIYGSEFRFNTSFLTEVGCTHGAGDSFCSLRSEFGNTAMLGGATVFDSFGQSVTQFQITASSGFDYVEGYVEPATNVPLPGTLPLLVAGLLFLKGVRTRT